MLPTFLALALSVAPPLTPVSPRLINVNGESTITFPANQITATFQIMGRDRDVAGARKVLDQKLRAVQKALHGAGIDEKHILVHEGGVLPEYRGNEVVAQQLSRTLVITFTDMAKFEDSLAAVMRAGGAQQGTLSLRNTEQKLYEQKARTAAAASAKERATNLVETLGGKLGLPRVVNDGSTAAQGIGSVGVWCPPEGSPTINLVELSVVAHVTVQFDIRDEG
ncbi:MAG: SIMPL domain-containing protein [Archangium sp.]|nr:SIMPL domain-containing protein [Archangium sp.]